jgi:hypothetical protein
MKRYLISILALAAAAAAQTTESAADLAALPAGVDSHRLY